jgi:hypothetical protein
MAAAARRVALEKAPTAAEEKRLERMQETVRIRIGNRLNMLRKEAGLSLRAMAMKANASPGYLSEGQAQVSARFCSDIAIIYCCPSGRYARYSPHEASRSPAPPSPSGNEARMGFR